MKQNIDILFQKFIKNTIKKKEFEKLMKFIENPAFQNDVEKMMNKYWKEFIKSEKGLKERKNSEVQALFRNIMEKIENKEPRPKSHTFAKKMGKKSFYSVAATVVIIAGLFFGYKMGVFSGGKDLKSLSATEEITLTLDDGRVKVISENGSGKIIGSEGKLIGAQDGLHLSYKNSEFTKELVYNVLNVPYGKRFDLTLSDGTKVKLNAGSSIRYPVRFVKGEDRKVFLNGEAYFDVSRDEARPFIVNAKDINVEVLGTEFNMSYYPEDDDISTVLVEGSVKLYSSDSNKTNDDSMLLSPGYLAAWNKTSRELSIEKVDTQIYTAWKDGTLLFKNASFRNIRKKLERRFNIPIENSYEFLEAQVYTASFTNENLGEIMAAFKEDTPFEFEYELSNNKIIITNQTTNALNN